jgi:hypothetical protein
MANRVVGETDAGSFWHTIDPAGPDLDVAAEAGVSNLLSLHKTLCCGRHFNADPVDEAFAAAHSFPACPG